MTRRSRAITLMLSQAANRRPLPAVPLTPLLPGRMPAPLPIPHVPVIRRQPAAVMAPMPTSSTLVTPPSERSSSPCVRSKCARSLPFTAESSI